MDEDFAHLVEKYGPPDHPEPFAERAAGLWKSKLPSGLLELWREYGVGMWADGKFQFCMPDRFASIPRIILDQDPQFNANETHVIGFGAFGDVLLWNEKTQKISIDLPYLKATADASKKDTRSLDPNISVTAPLMQIGHEDQFTLFEDTPSASPLFRKCLKSLGRLELGECYGLFPALALGGAPALGSVRRVKALEHFSILAQLGRVSLMEYSGGQERFVRHLGAQV